MKSKYFISSKNTINAKNLAFFIFLFLIYNIWGVDALEAKMHYIVWESVSEFVACK